MQGLIKTIQFCALTLLLTLPLAHALDGSASNQQAEFSKNSYDRYLSILQDLKAELKLKADELGVMTKCNHSGKLYTSAGCISVFPAESDPSAKTHSKNEPSNCAGDDVQVWSGATWSCKEIRASIASTGVNNQKKWFINTAKSCVSQFGRSCNSSDDTCPGGGNPVGKSCSESTCEYVFNTSTVGLFNCK